jgi:hypothetical protein
MNEKMTLERRKKSVSFERKKINTCSYKVELYYTGEEIEIFYEWNGHPM